MELLGAGQKVVAVAGGLEAHEIVLQHAIEDGLPPWELEEDVGRREGDMQEEDQS